MTILIPVTNIYIAGSINKDWSKLYSLDNFMWYISPLLVDKGFSINSKSAIVGKDDWYFLGNKYAQSIDNKRLAIDSNINRVIDRMTKSNQQWKAFYEANGVENFVIMIGPDKEHVYNEKLPSWFTSKRHGTRFYDDNDNVFDPLKLLLSEKKSHELYFKDDTHWNSLAGWYVYNELMSTYFPNDKKLEPEDIEISSNKTIVKNRGDLGKFLYLNRNLETYSYTAKLLNPDNVSFVDYDTKQKGYTGPNVNVGYSLKLSNILNDNALNHKRVLWFRDSFGGALSSFMHETYSNILHVHYQKMDSKEIDKVVKEFKPDIVIVTAVERTVLSSGFFRQSPLSY